MLRTDCLAKEVNAMWKPDEVLNLIDELFEEQALAVATLAAAGEMDDEVDIFSEVRRRALDPAADLSSTTFRVIEESDEDGA